MFPYRLVIKTKRKVEYTVRNPCCSSIFLSVRAQRGRGICCPGERVVENEPEGTGFVHPVRDASTGSPCGPTTQDIPTAAVCLGASGPGPGSDLPSDWLSPSQRP